MRGAIVAGLIVAGLAALPVSEAQATPGSWTQAQVNAAIDHGVAYLAANQNADGSWGSGVAETGAALAAFGVEANGNFSSLSPAYQTDVKNAITYLEMNQDTTPGTYFGSWTTFGTYQTYSTGLALLGLSFFTTVDPGVPGAIANGRTFLTGPDFQGPANTGCTSADGSPTAYFCGGWNYDAGYGRSDESNTGYAMTGLEVTGGIPAALIADNVNWQRHVQEFTGNPFATRNDGGADYEPGIGSGGFSSNANDSGSNLFGYADDGQSGATPFVAASIKFDQDVLDAYELMKANVGPGGLAMIAHNGPNEDGACTPDTGACDWYTSGDGGFHYSLFALTKGLGSYIPANLSDPNNWYAKVVDLLLSQQQGDGSWPPDGRDDFSTIFATALAVDSLGKAAVIQLTTSKTADSSTVHTGGQDGYTIKISNPNSSDVTLTDITDTLPSGFTYVSGSTTGVTTANPAVSGQNLTWSGSFTVPAGGSVSLHFNVTAPSTPGGPFYDNAGGDANGASVAPTGNTAPITVTSGDTTPPTCKLTATIAGPPKQIQITVQDTGSGLASVNVTSSSNSTTNVPPFTPGTTSPVVITSTKQNQSQGSSVGLKVTDVAGNVTLCDPALIDLSQHWAKAQKVRVRHLAQAESKIMIVNGWFGVHRIRIAVNGKVVRRLVMHNGQTREIDVARVMRPGNNNTITMILAGRAGGSATVAIHD